MERCQTATHSPLSHLPLSLSTQSESSSSFGTFIRTQPSQCQTPVVGDYCQGAVAVLVQPTPHLADTHGERAIDTTAGEAAAPFWFVTTHLANGGTQADQAKQLVQFTQQLPVCYVLCWAVFLSVGLFFVCVVTVCMFSLPFSFAHCMCLLCVKICVLLLGLHCIGKRAVVY